MKRRTLMIFLTMASLALAADAVNQTQNATAKIVANSTILDEKTMTHAYGRMIAKNCLGVQVTVENSDVERAYIVTGISVWVGDDAPRIGAMRQDILTTLAQQGQSKDPRNVALRSLTAIGLVAATVSTFAHVGPSFSPGARRL